VKNLDRLSDLLCGVIDLCELVRNVHPEEEWVEESEKAYERLCSFMNGLNTDTGLYKVSIELKRLHMISLVPFMAHWNRWLIEEIGISNNFGSSTSTTIIYSRNSSRSDIPSRLREIWNSSTTGKTS